MKKATFFILVVLFSQFSFSQKMYIHTRSTGIDSIVISQIDSITFTVQYDTIMPGPGLVAYYPFNGNANDESGNGHNGTVNGASLTTDRFGNSNRAYNFNGTSSTIELGSWFEFNRFTVSMWVSRRDTQQNEATFIENHHNTYHGWSCEQVMDSTEVYCFGVATTSGFPQTHFTLSANKWQHVVMLKDSTQIKVYVDGVFACSRAATDMVYTGSYLGLGRDYEDDYGKRFWNGRLDDIRIYNRALSDAEIQALYHEGGW